MNCTGVMETLQKQKEGLPLTRYCPFTKNACVENCEWHDSEGCVIWQVLKALKEMRK